MRTVAQGLAQLNRELRAEVMERLQDGELRVTRFAGRCGLAQSTVSNWVAGRRNLSYDNLALISACLRVDLARAVGGGGVRRALAEVVPIERGRRRQPVAADEGGGEVVCISELLDVGGKRA